MASNPMDRLFAEQPAMPEATRRATAVAALWKRAAMGHTVLAGGCACGLPAMHVSVADFELDLLDYLRARWAADASAVALIDGASGRVGSLVDALARDASGFAHPAAMLDDLETAIRSFAPEAGLDRAQRTG